MMKQTILLFLALLPLVVSAAPVEIGGINYNLVNNGKTAQVTSKTNKYSGAVVIPDKIAYNNVPYTVTSIGSSAFYGCSGLKSITIPSSVTSIGSSAFYGCSGLTSFNVPSSVTSIAVDAFRGCGNLSSITVDNSNTVYDSRDNCNAIIKKTTNELIIGCKGTVIANTVVSIGSEAFYGCSGLTSIAIPNSVTSIGSGAFYGCSGLTAIAIPDCVTFIGVNPFASCSNISSITVESNNTVYDSRDNCNAIINTATNELISGCNNTVITTTVVSIGENAFRGSSISGELRVPGNVMSIGDYAFNSCLQLTSVILEEGVEEVGWHCFSGPIGTLSLPTSLTYMSSMAIDPYVGSSSSGIFMPEGDLYVYSCSNTPPPVNDFAFYYVFAAGHLVVPYGCKEAYKAAWAWSQFGEYLEVGDVNGDGKLNVADVATLIAYVTGQEPKRFIAAAADVNCDGVIDANDITRLALSLLGGDEE